MKIKLFEEIPCLESDRLKIRRLDHENIPSLKELIENDKVYRYLPTFLFEKQFDDLKEMIDRLYSNYFDSKESIILGIYPKEENRLCGLAEFYGFKDHVHKISVGYRLLERHWGKGIATQTVSMMVDYLYQKTDIEIITASTMIENIASAHVLEKNDFLKVVSAVEEDWGYDKPTIVDKWIR